MNLLRLRQGWVQVWLLVNVALIVAVGLRLWQGTQVGALLATPARKLALTTTVPAEPELAPTRLEPIQQSALFYPARRFYAPPAVVALPPKPNYRLTGTFVVPSRPAVAMLNPSGGGSTRKVSPGDDLDGWTVLSVEASRVVLRLNGELYEITQAHTGTAVATGPPLSPLPATATVGAAPVTNMLPAPLSPVVASAFSRIKVLGNGGASPKRPMTGATMSPVTPRPLFQAPPH
jgi:hypothetical protein